MTMLKNVSLILSIFFFISCSDANRSVNPQAQINKESNELRGEWHLIERLLDPGDGSGTFQAVNEDKSISFFQDLRFESSQKLCHMITGSHDNGSGSYSISERTIYPENCDFETKIVFEIDKDHLIIYYPCIEACAEKYRRQIPAD